MGQNARNVKIKHKISKLFSIYLNQNQQKYS